MIQNALNVVSAIFITSLVVGCSQAKSGSENHPAFCEVGRTPIENEKVYYDLNNRKAYVANGTVSNAVLEFISNDVYLGFAAPMHLLLPTPEALESGEALSWNIRGYHFTVEPAPQKAAGWYLVRSRIISEPDNTGATTGPKMGKRAQTIWHIGTDVLFSVESGIIAYRENDHIGGDEFFTEFYLCSETKMDLYDLRSNLDN